MKTIKYLINDDVWIFDILDDDKFIKKHGKKYKKDSALTDIDKKTVDFKESEFDKKWVAHELYHIHFFYCFTESIVNLSLDNQEEVAAEMISHRIDLIVKQRNILFKLLTNKRKCNKK